MPHKTGKSRRTTSLFEKDPELTVIVCSGERGAQDAPAADTTLDTSPAPGPDTREPVATNAPAAPTLKRGRKLKGETTAAADTTMPGAEPSPAPAGPADDLVLDDGEMVTPAERDARQKLRTDLARARAARKAGPTPSQEREIDATLDQQAPGWREQAQAAKAEKDAQKKARLEKLKKDRAEKTALRRAALAASGKPVRPEHSNTAVPAPAPEDKAAPSAGRTLAGLKDRWAEALTRAGKTVPTVAGYKAAIGKACAHFGEDAPVASLTAREVQIYFESDPVTKTRGGKAARKSGVEKVRRALRLALAFAVAAGWIPEAPLPPSPKKGEAA